MILHFNVTGETRKKMVKAIEKLYDVMTQGSGDVIRMQPLYFLITTAGNDTTSSAMRYTRKALDIQAGRKIDPTFYSVIYGADGSGRLDRPKSVEESQSIARNHCSHRKSKSSM